MKLISPSVLLCALVVLGCSGGPGDQPDLGTVDGTVKMDGKPLKNARVSFQPENGRPSVGTTDEEGYYVLQYTADTPGAKVGKHTVMITTYGEDDEGNATPETVPAKYNVKTTLKAEVKPTSQTIDFLDLTSDGDIVQPEGAGDD